MTNEEIQRNIEFIIGQHAQFAVNFQKIEEAQAKFGSELQEVKDVLFTVVGMVGKLAEAQTSAESRISNLETKMTAMTERVDTLAERVDAFIVVVERYIGGNGRAKGKRKRPK